MQVRVRVAVTSVLISLPILSAGCFQNQRLAAGQKSAQTVLTATAIEPPSANLLVSESGTYAPATYQDVHVGDTLEFYWSGTNADFFQSTLLPDGPDTCPGSPGASSQPWVAANALGSTSFQVAPCQSGRTYIYTYSATDSASGNVNSAINMVHVIPQTTPSTSVTLSATIRSPHLNGEFAGPGGYLIANPGEVLDINWSSTGTVNSTEPTYSVDSPDGCGDPTTTLPALSGANGTTSLELQPCMGGHTYTIEYQVLTAGVVSATSRLIVRVRTNPVASDLPDPVLSLNNQTGDVTVHVGDTLNYAWSSTNADQGDSSILVSGQSIQGDCDDDTALGSLRRPWTARSPSGTLPPTTVPACRAGKTYTITFLASQSTTGNSVGATLVVHFVQAPGASPTPGP